MEYGWGLQKAVSHWAKRWCFDSIQIDSYTGGAVFVNDKVQGMVMSVYKVKQDKIITGEDF